MHAEHLSNIFSKAVTAARIGHVGKRAPLPGIATHTPDTKTHEMNRGLWSQVLVAVKQMLPKKQKAGGGCQPLCRIRHGTESWNNFQACWLRQIRI
ncbi:E3 ubiquitin-protein ligase [Trichinella pseudospiralis]